MNTTEQLFAWIESFTNLERRPGTSMRPYRLDRMKTMLSLYGNPERAYKTVHIAGSKGKGSTGVFLASILEAAGFKTGLYTSPHVVSYKERITRAGTEIADSVFLEAWDELRAGIPGDRVPGLIGQERPTTFELLTILAFLIYRRMGCSWAVIETGIGGRLDATNLIQPAASVITPIELEHTEVLGDTIEKIAFEKAGIIKQGVPVFVANQHPEAYQVLNEKAQSVQAPLIRLEDDLATASSHYESHQMSVEYVWRDGTRTTCTIGMAGDVQVENAALATRTATHLLNSVGLSPQAIDAAVASGLAQGKLPGRMEIVRTDPLIVLDAAHTPSSVEKLIGNFSRLVPPPRNLLFGCVRGKNFDGMSELLAQHFETIVVSTPGSFKESDPEAVWKSFLRFRDDVLLERDPARAVQEATRSGNPLLVTGSFYMLAEVRKELETTLAIEGHRG